MSDIDRYRAAVTMAIAAANAIAMHDVPRLLEEIHHADSVGALIDPTAYMAKADAMREDKEVLEAALPLYRIGRKLADLRAKRAGI